QTSSRVENRSIDRYGPLGLFGVLAAAPGPVEPTRASKKCGQTDDPRPDCPAAAARRRALAIRLVSGVERALAVALRLELAHPQRRWAWRSRRLRSPREINGQGQGLDRFLLSHPAHHQADLIDRRRLLRPVEDQRRVRTARRELALV